MECNPAALAYISAVWFTLAAWAVYNLLAASSSEAPFNITLDLLLVLAAAASRLLLVTCRRPLPVDAHGADGAAAGRCPRLAGYEHNDDDAGSYTAVQCVVCLGEVEDGELVKRLPACRHMFHQRCIDQWLVAARPPNVLSLQVQRLRAVSRPDGAC